MKKKEKVIHKQYHFILKIRITYLIFKSVGLQKQKTFK